MMGFGMGLGMLMMLIGFLVVLAAIGAAVYLGLRASRPPGHPLAQGDSARAILDRRLASGEISAEEYYERESALRDAQPLTGGR